jgi:hypothetical protein
VCVGVRPLSRLFVRALGSFDVMRLRRSIVFGRALDRGIEVCRAGSPSTVAAAADSTRTREETDATARTRSTRHLASSRACIARSSHSLAQSARIHAHVASVNNGCLRPSASRTFSSGVPPRGSPPDGIVARVQLLVVRAVQLPTVLRVQPQREESMNALLPTGSEHATTTTVEALDSTQFDARARLHADAPVSSDAIAASSSTPSSLAHMESSLSSATSVPILTERDLTDPTRRAQLWRDVSEAAAQGTRHTNSHSDATPSLKCTRTYMIERRLLPHLMAGGRRHDSAAQGSTRISPSPMRSLASSLLPGQSSRRSNHISVGDEFTQEQRDEAAYGLPPFLSPSQAARSSLRIDSASDSLSTIDAASALELHPADLPADAVAPLRQLAQGETAEFLHRVS